jgi:glycosyltransferase involved in cell wall biosynthesis
MDRSMKLQESETLLPPLVFLDPGNFTPLYDMHLASALAQRGWQARLVTSLHQFDDPPVLPGITVIRAFYIFLRWRWLKFLRDIPALRRIAKVVAYPLGLARLSRVLNQTRAGILHVQWAFFPPLDTLFWRRFKRRGWIVIFTAHEPSPLAGTLPSELTRSRNRLWEAADAVVVHGMDAAQTVRVAGIPEERIHILPPGAPAISTQIPRSEARLALGIEPEQRVILFLGYIKPHKGLHVLLQSIALVKKKCDQLLCLAAGECMDGLGRYQDLINHLGLEREVRLHGSYLPERMVPLYFSACDVVALPYLEAAYSGVLLSAYAYGRPVVATAVGGNTELIEEGQTGLLVPPGDPIALAAALSRVLEEPDTANRMGALGAERLQREYSWPQIAECTERVYRSAISNSTLQCSGVSGKRTI